MSGRLQKTSCSHLLPSEGNPQAGLFFVGEGAGEQGRPFVGPAGELLYKMIEAMGLKREQVYLVNIVECPSCTLAFEKRLKAGQPKVIVALGEATAQKLLQTALPLSKLRGTFHGYRGARLLPTFHPTDLLRSPESKREAWADLQQVARELGLKLPSKTEKKA